MISVSLFVCMFPNFPRRWSRLSSDSPRSLMIPRTVCRITGFKGRSRRFLSKSENLEYLFGIHKPQKKIDRKTPLFPAQRGNPQNDDLFPYNILEDLKRYALFWGFLAGNKGVFRTTVDRGRIFCGLWIPWVLYIFRFP